MKPSPQERPKFFISSANQVSFETETPVELGTAVSGFNSVSVWVKLLYRGAGFFPESQARNPNPQDPVM